MMEPIDYRMLADLVLVCHVAFVLFVVAGLFLILAGGALGWPWVRNRWFRFIHLTAIGVVVAQAWLGMVCPLTTLENSFREAASQASYPGSFIAYWLRYALYYRAPPWVFTVAHTIFGLLVVSTWFLVRPARPAGA